MKRRSRYLSIPLAMFLAAAAAQAQPKPIRSGDGFAIYRQAEAEDWAKLVEGGNLAAGKQARPGAPPNDHNTGGDSKCLTDGVLAGAEGRMWSDKRAVGWAYQPYARLTLDLGAPQPVGQVVMRLQVINKDNTIPHTIRVSLSDDGEAFSPVRIVALKPGGDLGSQAANPPRSNPLLADGGRPIPTGQCEPLPFDPPGIYAVAMEVGVRARFVRLDFALVGAMVADEIAIVPAASGAALRPIPPPVAAATEELDYVFDRRDQFSKLISAGNLVAGKKLRYSPTPTQYLNIDDDDPLQLTDGKFGERIDEAIWFERGCVGWQGPPLVTIFADVGQPQPIDSIVIRLLGGKAQNALEFPDEIKVLLSDDGREYHLAAARRRRGLDDLSADTWHLPEDGVPWVHNFHLPVKRTARYVAVQIVHGKQFVVSDELAVVRGADELPAFEPSPETRVTLVSEGVAFVPVWGGVLPVCENLPLRARLLKQDARSGADFDKPCQILLDVPDTLKVATAHPAPTEVEHEGRKFKRYAIPWAGEGTEVYLQSLLPAGQSDVLYTSGDSGGGPQNARRIEWRSLHIPRAQVPKRLHVSLSWAESISLLKTWPDYLNAQRHLGFNAVGTMPCYWRESDIEANRAALRRIRDAGFQIVQIESPAGAIAPDRAREETLSIYEKGRRADVCPAYRGAFYQKEHASFAQAAAWIEPDLIFYDIEAYWHGATNAELCERCRQRFQSGGFASWDEFRAAMGREIHVDMKSQIERALADAGVRRKVVYGSYRTEPITPLNDGLFSFDNTYPDLLQMAMPSLYVAGNAQVVADNVASNRAKMKANDIVPWLTTGCYGEFNPVRTRDMILEAFANGSRGITYYWYGHFDAAHFKHHAEAINIVAPIEDIFMDGQPLTGLACDNPKIKVCGMGQGEGADQQLAILVSNYQGVPAGTRVKVSLPERSGKLAASGGERTAVLRDMHDSGRKAGSVGPDGAFTVTIDDASAHLYSIGAVATGN